MLCGCLLQVVGKGMHCASEKYYIQAQCDSIDVIATRRQERETRERTREIGRGEMEGARKDDVCCTEGQEHWYLPSLQGAEGQ